MKDRLRRLQADDDRIGDVRGRGAMIADRTRQARHRPNPDPADQGRRRRLPRRGVIVLTCGTYGNVLRFLPPLAISDDLLTEALDILADVFKETR